MTLDQLKAWTLPMNEFYCEGGDHLMAAQGDHAFYAGSKDTLDPSFNVFGEIVKYTWNDLKTQFRTNGPADKRNGRRIVDYQQRMILCGYLGCMRPVRKRPVF